MPIKPELSYYYPIDWPQISRWVRFVHVERYSGVVCGGPMAGLVKPCITSVDGAARWARPIAMAAGARSLRLSRSTITPSG